MSVAFELPSPLFGACTQNQIPFLLVRPRNLKTTFVSKKVFLTISLNKISRLGPYNKNAGSLRPKCCLDSTVRRPRRICFCLDLLNSKKFLVLTEDCNKPIAQPDVGQVCIVLERNHSRSQTQPRRVLLIPTMGTGCEPLQINLQIHTKIQTHRPLCLALKHKGYARASQTVRICNLIPTPQSPSLSHMIPNSLCTH